MGVEAFALEIELLQQPAQTVQVAGILADTAALLVHGVKQRSGAEPFARLPFARLLEHVEENLLISQLSFIGVILPPASHLACGGILCYSRNGRDDSRNKRNESFPLICKKNVTKSPIPQNMCIFVATPLKR